MEIAWPICRQENWSRTRSMTCQSSSVDLAQGIRRTAILLFLWDQERRWLILSSQAQSDVLGRYDEIEVCWSCARWLVSVSVVCVVGYWAPSGVPAWKRDETRRRINSSVGREWVGRPSF